MQTSAKVLLKDAERAKQFFKERKLLLPGFAPKKRGKFLYFPISAKPQEPMPFEAVFSRAKFLEVEKPLDLKKALLASGKFSQEELEKLIASFDSVGDIALLDIPQELESKQGLIAKTALAINRHIKVVAKKKSAMKGEYRVREIEVIAGEKRTSTVYRESGVAMKLDLATVFFSPRLSFERERVAKRVKPGSNVLALFAGVGPFALVAAKKQPKAKVVGVELNPEAVAFFRENVKLNKMEKRVQVVQGDVNEVVPAQFANWADFIFMPAPHTATDFLDAAIAAAKRGCVVTFYGFERTDGKPEPFVLGAEGKILVSPVKGRVLDACERNKRKCKVLFTREARTYAPNVVQTVVDFQVL